MSHALYDFMPYGAPDQISGAAKRMFRATISSSGLWILVFVGAVLAVVVPPRTVEVETGMIVPYRELAAPPPLDRDLVTPPQVAIVAPAATPVVGMPVPVPDIEVPAEQTIASQEEIAAATGSETAGSGDVPIVVAPPAPEELPKLGDYVYADELPVLVKDVLPRYPDIAREAQLEGDVLLRVLVGKDGRVLDVHVDASVPMLDLAAIEAARQWVFKPAFANNHSVAVWITRRVRFRLTVSMWFESAPLEARQG